MRKLWIAVLLATIPFHATAEQKMVGLSAFYSKTDFGALGVVRSSSGASTPIISVVEPDGDLQIMKRGKGKFYLNTGMSGADPEASTATTYAMVLVFVAHPQEVSGKPTLWAFRNAKWWRQGCPPYAMACFGYDRLETTSFASDLHDHLLQDRQHNNRDAVDRDMNAKFDGYPEGTNFQSWDNRDFWNKKSSDEPICRKPGMSCEVRYYMLRFTPSPNPSTDKSLDFELELWSAKAVSIYVFSPTNTDDFTHHYQVSFVDG